jgi:thiol-disulfide isomerase/thioredoxin
MKPVMVLARTGLLLAAALAAHALAADPRPLDVQGLLELRAAHAGEPYILSMWSVHCVPCAEEMAVLREMHEKYPKVPIVFIAADSPAESERITRFLAKHDPGAVESYRYADEFEERMRFAIDPKWRGELPRSYFVDASGHAEARTGLPDRRWLAEWFAQAERYVEGQASAR